LHAGTSTLLSSYLHAWVHSQLRLFQLSSFGQQAATKGYEPKFDACPQAKDAVIRFKTLLVRSLILVIFLPQVAFLLMNTLQYC
jgi:hypothetical protein